MTKPLEYVEYEKSILTRRELANDPIEQLTKWWNHAISSQIYLFDAVCLSTLDDDGHPDSRIVLLKHIDQNGLVFFTNYHSKKSQQLLAHPYASLVIFWPKLERQIRIKGQVFKTSQQESENYFRSRPRGAQISAWASPQSSEISNREELETVFAHNEQKFLGIDVWCPPHWGGFRLKPHYFEFWQGRKSRLHDRFSYEKNDHNWIIKRLAP